jgi:ABC-2 type transport system permease protein
VNLAGTWAMTRLAFVRDRFRLPAYAIGLSAFLCATAAMFVTGPRVSVTDGVRMFAQNAALRMMGLASGPSVGAYTMLRDYLLLSVLAGLISALTVVRHTRQSEETGRAELVGSGVLGRYAGLAAALIVTVAGNLLLAVLSAGGLILNGFPVPGSLTAGASVGMVGIVFAGIAAVTAQLSSTTRGANGLAAAVLGVAFVCAGVGNMLGGADASAFRVDPAWPTWLSPIGWGELTRPFAGDHPGPLMVGVVVFAALAVVAGALVDRRDVGAGVIAERRGRASARAGLLSPLGLVWRLQRGAMLAWATGMALFGLVFGGMASNVASMGGATARWYMRAGASNQIIDAYRTSIIEMAGAAAAVFVVQMLLRMRSEEADGPLEPILAASVSRARWMASHGLNAALGALGLLSVFALSMGVTMSVEVGDASGQLRALLETAAVQVPAILFVGAVVVAATALLPRWTSVISWTYVAASILAGPVFGAATFQLPRWLQDVSPFALLPKLAGASFSFAPLAGLAAVAAALILAGLLAFRRRDLALPL